MNAINVALNNIKFSIPINVLELAFINFNPLKKAVMESLDSMITHTVIKPKVMVDCNLIGGIYIDVDLRQCQLVETNDYSCLIKVPKKLTGGKSIVSLGTIIAGYNMGIGNPFGAFNSYGVSNGCGVVTNTSNQLMQAANNMYNNLAYSNIAQTTAMQLLGDNLIYVYSAWMNIQDSVLNCTVENDENFENLDPRLYPYFSKLCIYAVETYIFNTLYITLGEGEIYGGHQLGQIKEIVDNYRDSNEKYDEYLHNEWAGVFFHNNKKAKKRLIRLMLGNNT